MRTQQIQSYEYNLGQLFSRVAKANATRCALVFLDKEEISYENLEVLSNRIANWLVAKGTAKGDVIAIFHDKSRMAFACMIACLKIGAIYVNLDPESPKIRLQRMLQTCKPKQLWVPDHVCLSGCETDVGECLQLDYTDETLNREILASSTEAPSRLETVDSSSIAYIMFTSGSTGFPKAATISHGNLLNFISWSKSKFDITPEDRLTNVNPMHFDNSVFDFYTALFCGACLVPVPTSLLKNPRTLLEALNPVGISIWFSVPSLIVYILRLRALRASDLSDLRLMCFGGEGFPKTSLRLLADLIMPRVRLANVYGPTECTCICSSYEVTPDDLSSDDLLPLGPISENFKFLIADHNEDLVQEGQVGELYLGGGNVGFGYFHNLEKTKEAFVQNPTNRNYRDIFYRTGDLVKYDVNRDLLLFCGRKDNQIKRMGHRIELEEIEHAIGAIPNVLENAVVFKKVGEEIGRIIAYVNAASLKETSLLSDLRKRLPHYMIPDQVVFRESLPKNQNGKIDRNILKNSE